MPSRKTPIVLWGLSGLFAAWLLAPAALQAQGGPATTPDDIFRNGGPPAMGGPSAPYAPAAGGGSDIGGSMAPGMMPGGIYPGMQPGMYPGGYGAGYGGMPHPGLAHAAGPENDWWPTPSFWTTFTKKVLPNSYLRVEFLNWNIDAFGNKIIGAEDFVTHVRDPFIVSLDDGTIRVAHVPDAGELSLKNTEGMRFTLGLPTRQGGAVELSYWNLFENEESYSDWRAGSHDPETGLPQVIAIPMYNQTGTGNNAIFYDQSWSTSLTSDVSGLEVKYLYDYSPTGTGVYIQPLIGIRSNSLEEEMLISGWTHVGGRRNAGVSSVTDNFLIGPQVGVRVELEWWKFRFGVEPRVGGGFNFYDADLKVTHWRFPGDETWTGEEDDMKFAGMFELGLYGKFEVHPNVTLFGGYNLLYLSRVTRPLDNIYFNDVPDGGRPLVRLTTDTVDMSVEGFNVGAEIRWR